MSSKISLLGVSILALVVAGCPSTPTYELSQYRNAFAAVHTASENILIDFAEAKERAEKAKASASATNSNASSFFGVDLRYGGGIQRDAVETRRTALRTIAKFNNVLTTLAEGKSVETVQNAAGGFVEAAGKFLSAAAGNTVPGLSHVAESVKILIGEFEKARLREEFRTALQNGAPVIDRMLTALIAERVDHIDLRKDEANLRHVDIVNDIAANVNSVRSLFAQFTAPPPPDTDPRQAIETALNKALKPAERALTFTLPVSLSYGAGGPAIDQEQTLLADQTIALIRERVAAFESNVEQFERLRNALNNYGEMLQKARTTLRTLVDALDSPQEFERMSEEFFEIAFAVKREVEGFKAARKAAR